MLKICNLREGLLVALMSIGTLTAEAAVDPSEKLNDIKESNYSKTEEEDLDLISKFHLEWQLIDLKIQKLQYQAIEHHLSSIQELCVSDTIETIEEMCKIPTGLLAGFEAGVSGLVTLKLIKLFYQEYVLTEAKKNFVPYRDKLRGPVSAAIRRLKFLNRGNYFDLSNVSREMRAARIQYVISHILSSMDKEIHEILKITQKEQSASAMQAVERLIDRAPKLSKIQIQIHNSKVKTPSPYNYLNFLDENTQAIVRAMKRSYLYGISFKKMVDANLMELDKKALNADSARNIRFTRYANLIKNASGAIILGSVTLFLLNDASALLSPGPISSQLDELRYEIDEIQVEIDQLEQLKDIAL